MTGTEILLIRHGETAWNVEGRIQGQLDVPLSSNGIWQAGRLAQRLASAQSPWQVAAIVASDLVRTWSTAQPLAARLGVAIQPEVRLRERSFGMFEGHTVAEVAQRWPLEFAAWRSRDPAYAIPGGESGQQLIERALDALRDIALDYEGATVAVVTHGGILDAAYRAANHLAWDAPRDHPMLNASINQVQAHAAPFAITIVDWADVAHLDVAADEPVA